MTPLASLTHRRGRQFRERFQVYNSQRKLCHKAADAIARLSACRGVGEGWKLVPIDDATRDHADSKLPRAMIDAGEEALSACMSDIRFYKPGETTDWDGWMIAVAVYRAMLAAAPLPPMALSTSHPLATN